MANEYYENDGYSNPPSGGRVVRSKYDCVGCGKYERYFFIQIAEDRSWLAKVGQEPSWQISGNDEVEKLLGPHRDYLRKGMISESQGYGIGAFAYYRRIVEEIIDGLLTEIGKVMAGDDRAKYAAALAHAEKTHIAADKIELVKDLLPPILRPDGMNPLSVLHSALSEGLHAGSEDECLDLASTTRQVIVYLASQLALSKTATASFYE